MLTKKTPICALNIFISLKIKKKSICEKKKKSFFGFWWITIGKYRLPRACQVVFLSILAHYIQLKKNFSIVITYILSFYGADDLYFDIIHSAPAGNSKKKIHDLNGFLALLNIQFIFISYVMAIKIYSMFNMHDDFIFHIFIFQVISLTPANYATNVSPWPATWEHTWKPTKVNQF